MRGMITGQYIAGNSIIHRMDPRTKIMGCLVVIFATAWPGLQIPVLLFNMGVIIVLIQISQVGTGKMLLSLRSLRTLFLLTFICQVFLTQGDPLWQWGIIMVSKQGIYLGISTFLRLVILYLSASLLTMTTSTLMLSAGLESLLSPVNYLRLPVHRFAMIINISLRFVPTIIEEAETISRAQRSRGARFNSGPLYLRMQSVLSLIIPLLAASLQRANDLALAMESRCYTGKDENYIRVTNLSFATKDWLCMGLFGTVFVLPALYSWIH